ncbi:MAG: NUDIX domain-containing protein [bacterium]
MNKGDGKLPNVSPAVSERPSGLSRPAYLQAAAVPWRPGEEGPEVLLISGRQPADSSWPIWILPQGGVEPGQTPAEAAAAEAWEEAGVEGTIGPDPFTFYEYETGNGWCRVSVFRMRVEHEARSWPEDGERSRQWLPWHEAIPIISGEALRDVLVRFHSGNSLNFPGF